MCLLRWLSVKKQAEIAQLVEQWTENPRVTSSSLVPGIAKPSQSGGFFFRKNARNAVNYLTRFA